MNILEVSCFNIHMPCSYCIARYFVGGSIVLPYPENSDFLQNYTTDIANSKFFGRISTSKRYPFNSLHNNDKLWGRLNEYLSEVHARERGPQTWNLAICHDIKIILYTVSQRKFRY